MDSIKADHGFNMDSKSVKNLLQTMSELTLAERRDFLQFTTGSPKLPIGGKVLYYKFLGTISNMSSRVQSPNSNVHCGLQAERAALHIRRLSPQCHDLRQLPQVAGLLFLGRHETSYEYSNQGGPGCLPSVII